MLTATANGFLGGQIVVSQPSTGFRSGLDAVMLAASVPADHPAGGSKALELGAGTGAASLCLAARATDMRITGIEIAPDLVAIANANAAANAMAGRVHFECADVLNLPPTLTRQFDHVFANPPFYAPGGQTSPNAAKARAKADDGTLADWLRVGLKRTRSGGTFTVIVSADRLSDALGSLPNAGITVFTLWPKAGVAAKRVLIQVRRGAKSPLVLHGGLTLHTQDGTFTPQADAILRGAALAMAQTP